jgi:hypothetical protein
MLRRRPALVSSATAGSHGLIGDSPSPAPPQDRRSQGSTASIASPTWRIPSARPRTSTRLDGVAGGYSLRKGKRFLLTTGPRRRGKASRNPLLMPHTLAVVDVLVAVERLTQEVPTIRLTQLLLERDIRRRRFRVQVPAMSEYQPARHVAVVPDALFSLDVAGTPSTSSWSWIGEPSERRCGGRRRQRSRSG